MFQSFLIVLDNLFDTLIKFSINKFYLSHIPTYPLTESLYVDMYCDDGGFM